MLFRGTGSKWRLRGAGAARGREEILQVQGQEQGREEIAHVQGWRNTSKLVGNERGHQTADRQKPQSQKTNQSNLMDHSLVYLNETMNHAV